MFEKALIATDPCTSGFPEVECVRGLQALGIKSYYLLHCLGRHEIPGMDITAMEDFLKKNLDKRISDLDMKGFDVQGRVTVGSPHCEVYKAAVEFGSSLIVVGAFEHTLTCEIMTGGLAGAVIHNMTMPTIVIRLIEEEQKRIDYYKKKGRYEFLRHILFPTDFSENSEQALAYLKYLVKIGAEKVTLLHVQNRTIIEPHLVHRLDEFNETDLSRLEEIKKELLVHASGDIDVQLPYGFPFTEIMGKIREQDISLVIMGSQGRGYLKEIFLGSTSYNVARHSEAPVLLVPIKR